MIWIIISVLMMSSLVLFGLRTLKGIKYSLEALKRTIKALLIRGYSNGILMIEVCHSQNVLDFRSTRVLEFRKYIHAPGDYGITLFFPPQKTTWSQTDVQKLQEFCTMHAIPYAMAQKGEKESFEVLSIDFGKDFEWAYTVCKNIFLDVFELDEETKFFALFENGAVEDILIDR